MLESAAAPGVGKLSRRNASLLLYAVIFIVLVSLFMFAHKVIYKRRMERTLGRKVDDRELTSLSSWMSAEDEKGKK